MGTISWDNRGFKRPGVLDSNRVVAPWRVAPGEEAHRTNSLNWCRGSRCLSRCSSGAWRIGIILFPLIYAYLITYGANLG